MAEVACSAVEEALRRAAMEGSVDATLRSRNRWNRAVRYSEAPSVFRKQSIDPYDGQVRLQLSTSPDGKIALTVLPTGAGEDFPWWLETGSFATPCEGP